MRLNRKLRHLVYAVNSHGYQPVVDKCLQVLKEVVKWEAYQAVDKIYIRDKNDEEYRDYMREYLALYGQKFKVSTALHFAHKSAMQNLAKERQKVNEFAHDRNSAIYINNERIDDNDY